MSRFTKFSSIFGENWVVGKYLLPELSRLGLDQNGELLDLACGESPFRSYFPKVKSYLRVDRDPLDGEVTSGDMLAIPLANDSVDIVLLFQAITDVANPVDVLKEVKRVLRPEGQVLIFESMAYPEHDAPHDFYRLMPEGLRWLAAEAGLNMQECNHLGGLFARFASLWNTYVMGGLRRYWMTKPLALVGVGVCNLFCYILDRVAPHPRLAPDYLAVLTVDDIEIDK